MDVIKPRIRQDSFSKRSGATIVETALILPILLFILIAAIDFSLIVLNNNSLAEAARRLSRTASVRGENSEPEFSMWGPDTFNENASEEMEICEIVREAAVCISPEKINVQVEWPDGSCRVNDRVCVSLQYSHQPFLSFTGKSFLLQVSSDVRIRH
ncbi:TadE-like protein [Thalassoglobus neptunius]|uniref:TadE-like protein n=1 Tax=Thalassoglobus neptunius TaxID=1938619 RepID=A0A5C5UTG1_9PLAN|nr:TadE-like protein [Thalassoglobus neptunius]